MAFLEKVAKFLPKGPECSWR